MKKVLHIFKIILIAFFTLFIILILFLFFFSPKEKRFSEAEHWQGLFLSQTLFDILIFQHPEDSNSYFEKSVAFNKRGDFAKGFELLNKAVDIKPDWHLGYRGWLRLVKIKDYRGTIKDLNRLDSLTPNFVDYPWGDNIHYLLGLSYKGLNEYEKALNEFDKVINSAKDSSWVNHNTYLYKGIILKNRLKYSEALENFDACIKYNYGNSTEASYQKGLIYKNLNNLDSAKASFNKSFELFNKGYKHKDTYNEVLDELYLSDILIELKKFDE